MRSGESVGGRVDRRLPRPPRCVRKGGDSGPVEQARRGCSGSEKGRGVCESVCEEVRVGM